MGRQRKKKQTNNFENEAQSCIIYKTRFQDIVVNNRNELRPTNNDDFKEIPKN